MAGLAADGEQLVLALPLARANAAPALDLVGREEPHPGLGGPGHVERAHQDAADGASAEPGENRSGPIEVSMQTELAKQ